MASSNNANRHGAVAARTGRLRMLGLGLAAFVAGMMIAGRLSDRTPSAERSGAPGRNGMAVSPDEASEDRSVAGPRMQTEGVPAGFTRTQPGAVTAAATFVATGQALLDMDPLAAEEAVRQMAAEATADTQVTEMLGRLSQLRDALAGGQGPTVYRQSPISWRVEGFDGRRARVAIWSVGILSRESIAPPQAGWSISDFDLVWERDDWRIWSETVTPGPAPLLDDSAAPATSEQLASALQGYTDFGGAR